MTKRQPSARPLTAAQQQRLRTMVTLNGEAVTCGILACSRYTLSRAMSGLPMYEGNRNELTRKLKALQ